MNVRRLDRTDRRTAPPGPTSVDVVAPDPLLRAGAAGALAGNPEVTVVDPGDSAEVVVLVVDAVTDDALDAVQEIRAADHRPEVVLVPNDLAAWDALRALMAGARGLLRRSEADGARLARAVVTSAGGDCTVPPDMLGGLLDPRTRTATVDIGHVAARGSGLSDRERAVLELVADGRDTGEIARELSYSARTVTGVLHDITHRFRLRNRAHAVAFAMRAGLL